LLYRLFIFSSKSLTLSSFCRWLGLSNAFSSGGTWLRSDLESDVMCAPPVRSLLSEGSVEPSFFFSSKFIACFCSLASTVGAPRDECLTSLDFFSSSLP
jgi:hypothetical protein